MNGEFLQTQQQQSWYLWQTSNIKFQISKKNNKHVQYHNNQPKRGALNMKHHLLTVKSASTTNSFFPLVMALDRDARLGCLRVGAAGVTRTTSPVVVLGTTIKPGTPTPFRNK